MGRLTYVCATCSEHFTRKYSATRHNITIHGNGGEIVPLLDFLVGGSSGRYQASHPSWYRRKRIHQFGRPTVADSVGDTFRPRDLQQEIESRSIPTPLSPPSASQPQPQGASPYPTDRIPQPIDTTNDQGTLSQETILKIQELKRLIYKYPQYHRNPGGVINCIIYYCSNGDNTLLDEKLEQLRTFDSTMGYHHI